MPWRSATVKNEREAFITRARDCANFSALCREFGISRTTGYVWRSRSGPEELSRRPKTSPRRTPEQVESKILELRDANPAWGAKKLHELLKGTEGLPSVRTVGNILLRIGRIDPEDSAKCRPPIRFEREKCNQLWQVDFKGEFPMADGNNCYPLDIVDDHSRFCIALIPEIHTRDVVVQAFLDAFKTYGLPDAVLSDNGGQFSGIRRGITKLELLLMDLDIRPMHGRAYHPQTQGKIERFHGTMKRELLKGRMFSELEEARTAMAEWRNKYNTLRPHEALEMKTPAAVYKPSKRELPEKIAAWEYSGEWPTARVNKQGYVRAKPFRFYLSETMAGKTVELRPLEDGEKVAVCYRNYRIATLETAADPLPARAIRRL